MHKEQFAAYEYEERSKQRCDIAPRGYAKTTVRAFGKIIHDVCYGLERYIVISSNTEAQSVQKVADIKNELMDNAELIEMYGKFFNKKNVGKQEIFPEGPHGPVKIEAAGSKKEIRGKRYGESRPTKIVIDDFEHSHEVENVDIRDKYIRTFDDVFTKLGTKYTNIEVVGTMLHPRSMLAQIKSRPGFTTHFYRAVEDWPERADLWEEWKKIYTNLENPNRLKDSNEYFKANQIEMEKGSKVLWPEHETILDLYKELVDTGRRSFFKEKQNDPQSDEDKVFDPETFRYFIDHGDEIEICATGRMIAKAEMTFYGALDPATGQTKPKVGRRPDFTAIINGYADRLGRLFVFQADLNRKPPSTNIEKIFDYHELLRYFRFSIEENLYRNLLFKNMRDEEMKREKKRPNYSRLHIKQVWQTEPKERRIFKLEPKIVNGYILFNKALNQEFFSQMFEFPSQGAYDDGPDALEQLWQMIFEDYHVGAIPQKPRI